MSEKRGRYRKRFLKKRCGCAERRWPECGHPWYFAWCFQRTEYRFNLNNRAGKPGAVMSKGEAEALADELRAQIRKGIFNAQEPEAARRDVRLTLGDAADRYLDEYIPVVLDGQVRSRAARVVMESYVNALRRREIPAARGTTVRLESKPLDDITAADVEHVRTSWPLKQHARKGGRTGPNRALKRLRALFNWAIIKGLTRNNPFKPLDHGVTVVRIPSEKGRTRRLEPGEEARLLAACPNPSLIRDLIQAALWTGCRKGELLGLQWRDVKPDRGVLLLPAEITKTRTPRDVPITPSLKAILEMRKHAPDGSEHPPEAFVFGTPFGEPVTSIRAAWEEACEKAQITGLTFHDLRREFASRLLEAPGNADHQVKDALGHANLSTTSRYLSTTRVGLQRAYANLERHQRQVRTNSRREQKSAQAPVRQASLKSPAKPLVN